MTKKELQSDIYEQFILRDITKRGNTQRSFQTILNINKGLFMTKFSHSCLFSSLMESYKHGLCACKPASLKKHFFMVETETLCGLLSLLSSISFDAV